MVRLLRFPEAIQHEPAIDSRWQQHPDALAVMARHWFAVLRSCGDDIHELLHDGHPTACVADAAFAYVNVFRAHINVGFFLGAELADPDGLLEGTGKFMRHVKLKPESEVNAATLRLLIETAYRDMQAHLRSGPVS